MSDDDKNGGSVKERLVRIETKMDSILSKDGDKEKRIRSLERHKWTQGGVVALAIFLFKEHIGTAVKKIFLPVGLMVLLSGCTVISNNRVFPKLAPFWTAEAKAQRESNAHQKVYNMYLNGPAVGLGDGPRLAAAQQRRDY